jgi:FixJ family two-component response regulator
LVVPSTIEANAPAENSEMIGTTEQNCGRLVIVVDDDDAVRNSLKFSLEIEGFAVRLYAGGAELLDSGELGNCACLVIDQNMPGMSGLETVRQLRDRNISVPAILITGHPNAILRASASDAGIDIVEKPLFGNALIEGIRGVIKH